MRIRSNQMTDVLLRSLPTVKLVFGEFGGSFPGDHLMDLLSVRSFWFWLLFETFLCVQKGCLNCTSVIRVLQGLLSTGKSHLPVSVSGTYTVSPSEGMPEFVVTSSSIINTGHSFSLSLLLLRTVAETLFEEASLNWEFSRKLLLFVS